MRGFVSDKQRRGFFANLGRRGFSSASCIKFSESPFDPKKTLDLLEIGIIDPATLTDEQKARVEEVQEEKRKTDWRALKRLEARIDEGRTYRPKNWWSDDPIKVGFIEPKVIRLKFVQCNKEEVASETEAKDSKTSDEKIKKILVEDKFSRHIKYPIKEKIAMKLVEPDRLDIEYEGERKTLTDSDDIDYVKRTIGPFATKKLEDGIKLNEYDIYGDGRQAMDMMFRGESKFSKSEDMARIEEDLERAHRQGNVSAEDYSGIRRILQAMKVEQIGVS